MSDVDTIVAPRAAALAAELVAGSGGRLDLPQDLTLQVPWDMTERYFGTGGPDAATMQGWTTTMFWYLFGDLGADPELECKALSDAAGMRDYLDGAIAARKAAPIEADDLLNRCLALQAAGTPGMDDPGIRNNLLGLLIGAIPTISKACCLALDELFRQPQGLRWAQNAARDDDDERLARCIWEALRFNPHNPVIYRRAARDAVVAPGTLRQMKVRKGQMVFAATLSAMFDRRAIDAPDLFRIDRPFDDYILWGTGMHTCFGAAINAAVIPAILKPLLAMPNLRRAEGLAGQVQTGGTPFPQHFTVIFDAR
jgi:cytochrome P450